MGKITGLYRILDEGGHVVKEGEEIPNFNVVPGRSVSFKAEAIVAERVLSPLTLLQIMDAEIKIIRKEIDGKITYDLSLWVLVPQDTPAVLEAVEAIFFGGQSNEGNPYYKISKDILNQLLDYCQETVVMVYISASGRLANLFLTRDLANYDLMQVLIVNKGSDIFWLPQDYITLSTIHVVQQ